MKNIILSLALLLGSTAICQTPAPPEVIDNRWFLVSMNKDDSVACYVDMSTLGWDDTNKCSTIWVRVYDRNKQAIILQKWGYRNAGTEWTSLATSIFTPQMKLVNSWTTKPWEIEFNAVVPGSFAQSVQQAASEYIQRTQRK